MVTAAEQAFQAAIAEYNDADLAENQAVLELAKSFFMAGWKSGIESTVSDDVELL